MKLEEATALALQGKLKENKKLVKENNKIGYEAGICPNCGADLQNYEEVEWYDDSIGYPFTCSKCGKSGEEYYNLSYSETVIKDEE